MFNKKQIENIIRELELSINKELYEEEYIDYKTYNKIQNKIIKKIYRG